MIAVVAVCPPAPFLVPGLAPRMTEAAGDVVRASLDAVAALSGADRIAVLSVGSAGILRPGTRVSAARFARSDVATVNPLALPSGFPDGAHAGAHDEAPDPAPPPGAGTIVAASLLTQAGINVPTSALQTPDGSAVRELLPVLADGLMPDGPDRIGLLVMGDGAACHGEHSPGGADERAEAFDRAIVTAIESGDPAELGRRCAAGADVARQLRAETFAAFEAMAMATDGAPPADVRLLHYSAPFGIGYVVATWRWDGGR